MRQARAVPLPNETLHIEEVKFWLKMMQDHTQFIRSGLPSDCKDYIEASKEFHKAFCSVMQKAEKLKSVKQSGSFIQEITNVMQEFCIYQKQILAERLCGKLQGSHFPFFIDHLLREARCFTDFLQRMQETKTVGKSVSHTKEVVIWLRFMSDHAKLMAQYLDPSEYRMRKLANEFSANFDQLVLQARCLSSMLYCQRSEIRAFHRFLLDVRLEVQKLRDFHKTAEALIADCQLLGILNLELASHMRRETEHCLLMIALLEKELIKHRPNEFCDDVEEDVWLDPERSESQTAETASLAADEAVAESLPESADSAVSEEPVGKVTTAIDDSDDGGVSAENRTITPLEVAEPVVAILEIPKEAQTKSKQNGQPELPPIIKAEAKIEPSQASQPAKQLLNEAAAKVPEVSLEAINPKNTVKEKTVQIQDSETKSSQDAALIDTQTAKRERLYAKASDYKLMPNKFAGAAPGERCLNQQKGMRLPRPLGKKD